ncbi:MAG: hypothetical protein HKO64_02050 [Xanthomonadales bacterium]|nr:hypothetical protein [Xanthomonadales bacterium]
MFTRKLLIFIPLSLTASLAVAGLTQPQVVDVDLTALFAQGDQWTARTASNDTEFIGCGVRKFDDGAGGATAFGFCQAEDADGERAFCNTANEDLLDAMEATSSFAYITFNWNEDGECTRIGNSTQSFYLPNLKTK